MQHSSRWALGWLSRPVCAPLEIRLRRMTLGIASRALCNPVLTMKPPTMNNRVHHEVAGSIEN
jgi:hypothetical protein